jgi:hypothetical protein
MVDANRMIGDSDAEKPHGAAIFLGLETKPFYTSAVSTLRRSPGCRNGISPRD